MRLAIPRLCLAGLLMACGWAVAGTAYQCTATDGRVIYQGAPCPSGQQQQTLQLDDSQPSTPPLREPVASSTVAASPPPHLPATPLPLMYRCSSAVDGKSYISDNGQPAPYQVPFGVLGATQQPLSQVYSPANGSGASAPELNRGHISANLVANHYVWVQDSCRELSRAETCHALRDAYDANEEALQRAFKSDQPPLEQREQELVAQLRSCR